MNNGNSEYSKALFMLALEHKELDFYAECLKNIKTVIAESPQYLEYLFSPAEPLSDRLSSVQEAFGWAPEHIVAFLKLVCENGRLRELPDFLEDFFELKRIHENSIVAEISSAVPLSDVQKQRLEQKLADIYKKQITAVYNIDKNLIAGMKIEIDGKTLDGSLLKKLSLIKGAMDG